MQKGKEAAEKADQEKREKEVEEGNKMHYIEYIDMHLRTYIGMSLFKLIEKNNRVWISSDCLSQLPALFIAGISWRGTCEPTGGLFIHIFRHVDAYQVFL